MNSIYLWTWTDNTGKHSTTTVGTTEYYDQAAYLKEGKSAGWITDYQVTYNGENY